MVTRRKNLYAYIWLKYNRFKSKYLWWNKHYRSIKKVKRLEKELFE